MATDPRAPRLAATTTLLAAVLLLATGGNLYFEQLGSSGVTVEEIVAIFSALLLLVVARFANVEHEVPEIGRATAYRGPEDLDQLTSVAHTSQQVEEINPTTANILTSILGQQAQTNTADVNSAMDTLSSGEFGEAVNQTMKESWEQSESTMNQRQATQADEVTGQTLQRTHVEPVPLPGKEDEELIDPRTIPGLEPDRVFITEGLDSVPLPALPSMDAPSAERATTASPITPKIDLPELPDDIQSPSNHEAPPQESPIITELELPDLDDLFLDEEPTSSAPSIAIPELPNIDDLF